MVGGFSTHAVCSGTNLHLCSRCLIVLPTLLELAQFGECESKTVSLFFLYAHKLALPGKLRMA